MKEAELQVHEKQKQHRLSISDPTPQLSPSKVYSVLFANNPTAAGSSVLPGFDQLSQSSSVETLSSITTVQSVQFRTQ